MLAIGCLFFGDRIMGRTITALEVQKHNKERVNVYLDGEFAFGLPTVEAAHLHKGQVLAEEEIKALQAVDTLSRAFDQAVRLLSRRPYSTAEIRRYLETKQVPSAVIDEVLAKLAHLGYVDDRAFAAFWVENRERFRPRGPHALRYELRQKGIPDDLIEAVLSAFDARGSAYRAAQEKVRRLRRLTPEQFRAKLGAFLVQRGFGYDIVREVIDQMIDEINENEPEFFADEE
jgi:regulatory protein